MKPQDNTCQITDGLCLWQGLSHLQLPIDLDVHWTYWGVKVCINISCNKLSGTALQFCQSIFRCSTRLVLSCMQKSFDSGFIQIYTCDQNKTNSLYLFSNHPFLWHFYSVRWGCWYKQNSYKIQPALNRAESLLHHFLYVKSLVQLVLRLLSKCWKRFEVHPTTSWRRIPKRGQVFHQTQPPKN